MTEEGKRLRFLEEFALKDRNAALDKVVHFLFLF